MCDICHALAHSGKRRVAMGAKETEGLGRKEIQPIQRYKCLWQPRYKGVLSRALAKLNAI